jgi:predicted metal-dependent HD superfamily phosphohydrolase
MIADMEAILFALFYHDAIYNVLKQDNEEKSALLAERRMKEINVPAEIVSKCVAIIRATKLHEQDEDEDINLFTDADLSVLGSDEAGYKAYAASIRKEYSIYPDLVYNAGRKKVLGHFLGMSSIYKTTFFRGRYEEQARANLQRELEEL